MVAISNKLALGAGTFRGRCVHLRCRLLWITLCHQYSRHCLLGLFGYSAVKFFCGTASFVQPTPLDVLDALFIC